MQYKDKKKNPQPYSNGLS